MTNLPIEHIENTEEIQAIQPIINNIEDTEFNLSPAKRFGPLFKKNREEQNLSLADVSARIKLSSRQLEAIENGDWDKLPSGAFVRGALRSYAKHLNFDVEPVLQEYTRFHETSIIDNTAKSRHTNNNQKNGIDVSKSSVQTINTMGASSTMNINKNNANPNSTKKFLSIITIIGFLGTIAFIIHQTQGLWQPILKDMQSVENNGGNTNNTNGATNTATTNTDTNNPANNVNNLNSSVATMQETTDIVAIPSVSQALNNQVALPEIQEKNAEVAIDTSALTKSTGVNAIPTVTTVTAPLQVLPTLPATGQVQLKMEIGSDSWISVKGGQKSTNLVRETKTAGSVVDTVGELPLKFSIRNPSTIKIFCNGKPYLIDEQKAKKLNADFIITSC